MKALLLKYRDRVHSSFWFVPGIMTSVAVALASATVALDKWVPDDAWIVRQGWAYAGGAEGASLVLSTIAGSMITIAGVVFSMTLATAGDALFRLERGPGQYVVMGCPLVTVWPGDRVTAALVERINSAFSLGYQRTAAQDIEFPIHQIVEIAVRALSPGINDPFTALTCADRLASALHRLAQRELPSPFRLDEQN